MASLEEAEIERPASKAKARLDEQIEDFVRKFVNNWQKSAAIDALETLLQKVRTNQ